jgi:hypothetical protein
MSNQISPIGNASGVVLKITKRIKKKFQTLRDRNKCGNNVWKRVDARTQILICGLTNEKCGISTCPIFNKQS